MAGLDQGSDMVPAKALRRVEIQTQNGSFVEAQFAQIEAGDYFRMFEPDGSPVTVNGNTVFLADSHARVNTDHRTLWSRPDHAVTQDAAQLALSLDDSPGDVVTGGAMG